MSLYGVSSDYDYSSASLIAALSGWQTSSTDSKATTESTGSLDFATISQEAMAEYEASQQRVGGDGSKPPPPPPPPPSGGMEKTDETDLTSDYLANLLYNEEDDLLTTTDTITENLINGTEADGTPPPPPPPPGGGKGDGPRMDSMEDSEYSFYDEEYMNSNYTMNSSSFLNSLQTRMQLLGSSSNSLLGKAV